METRVCKGCNEEKELNFYYTYKKKGKVLYFGKCKECTLKSQKEKNDFSPERQERIKAKKEERNLYDKGLKTCITCKKTKRLLDFPSTGHTNLDGRKSFKNECQECNYKKNKERILKRSKERYHKNPEKKLKQNKENWIKAKEDPRFKEKEQKRYKEYYEKKKKIIFSKQKERRKTSWKYNLSGRIRSRLGEAIKKNGYKKKSKTAEILGADWDTIKLHIEQKFEKNMNWECRDQWHIDHIIPLAAAENEEELYALAYYKNLQPLWADINQSKNDDYDPEDKRKYLEWYEANVKKID